MAKQNRGFRVLSPEKQAHIASLGGKAAHAAGTAHEFTPEEASLAGKLGGKKISRDRKHMAEIGRLGGAKRKGSLTDASVRAIRKLYREGSKQISIAKIFGVSPAVVSLIICGRIYKRVK